MGRLRPSSVQRHRLACGRWPRPLVTEAADAVHVPRRGLRRASRRGDLELYMGMPGHAMFVRRDRRVFAHVHPSGSAPMAALEIGERSLRSRPAPRPDQRCAPRLPADGLVSVRVAGARRLSHLRAGQTGRADRDRRVRRSRRVSSLERMRSGRLGVLGSWFFVRRSWFWFDVATSNVAGLDRR